MPSFAEASGWALCRARDYAGKHEFSALSGPGSPRHSPS